LLLGLLLVHLLLLLLGRWRTIAIMRVLLLLHMRGHAMWGWLHIIIIIAVAVVGVGVGWWWWPVVAFVLCRWWRMHLLMLRIYIIIGHGRLLLLLLWRGHIVGAAWAGWRHIHGLVSMVRPSWRTVLLSVSVTLATLLLWWGSLGSLGWRRPTLLLRRCCIHVAPTTRLWWSTRR
jgi:hypothetical protein